MARFFVDELDEEPVYDGTESFAGGMVSLVKPQLLAPNQCSDLQNVDIDRSGRIQTRRGTVALGSLDANRVRGLGYYAGTSTNYLLRVANGVMKSWDGATWATVAGYTSAAGTEVDIVQVGPYVYANTGTAIYQWTGTGSATVVAGTSVPSACKHLVSHTKRLFAIGTAQVDDIQPSTLIDGTSWSNANLASFRVGGDGDPITGAVPWHNNLLAVLKRTSIWVVDADPLITNTSGWTISLINSRVGCVAWRSAVQVGNDIFFLSDDGVRSIQRTINDNQIGVSLPLSDAIRPMIDRINWASADQSCAAYSNNHYMLAVPLDASTTPNYVLVYNTFTQSWSGYWTGWSPTVFAASKFSGTLKLNFGEVAGTVKEWLGWKSESAATDADYTDAGTAIASSITTKSFGCGDAISDKTGFSYELEFLRSVSDATVNVLLNENNPQLSYSGVTRVGAVTLPIALPFTLSPSGAYRIARDLAQYGPFRSIQYQIASTSKKLAVQGVTMSGFVDTMQPELN